MIMETDRLLLLSPDEVTADALCNYYNVNEKFLEKYEPLKEKEFFTKEYQQNLLKNQVKDWENKVRYRFYITLKEQPGTVIGFCTLGGIIMNAFCSCFLGYSLSEANIRKGYMSEAVSRIVEFAFKELHLHRIEANIMPRNKASIGVVQKCHFVKEGFSKKYLKINGVWEDHIHYVLLNPDME
ncbi:MAG: GNAT family protein [Lachnospiraceae bacterium]|nr:GNAT family protein [Lachnospiraceae bacterium]